MIVSPCMTRLEVAQSPHCVTFGVFRNKSILPTLTSPQVVPVQQIVPYASASLKGLAVLSPSHSQAILLSFYLVEDARPQE